MDHFLGDAFGVLSCHFWSIVLQSGAQLPIHTLNCWTEQSVVLSFQLGVCLSVTFLIVDPWQSCVCCIRSGVTQCTLLMVLYLDCTCQCELHAVLWSHIGALMHRLDVEPCSTADFHSLLGVLLERSWWPHVRWCETGRFQEQGQCFFIGLSCSIPIMVFYSFSLSLLSVYRLVL